MKDSPELGGFSAGTVGRGEEIEPSIWNALPHFVPLAIFPLVINAAIYGGWWIAGPFVYFLLADRCDAMLGMDERNMDPRKTRESQLFWYKLTIWLWALFWPATLLFVLWQILVIGHLSAWDYRVDGGGWPVWPSRLLSSVTKWSIGALYGSTGLVNSCWLPSPTRTMLRNMSICITPLSARPRTQGPHRKVRVSGSNFPGI